MLIITRNVNIQELRASPHTLSPVTLQYLIIISFPPCFVPILWPSDAHAVGGVDDVQKTSKPFLVDALTRRSGTRQSPFFRCSRFVVLPNTPQVLRISSVNNEGVTSWMGCTTGMHTVWLIRKSCDRRANVPNQGSHLYFLGLLEQVTIWSALGYLGRARGLCTLPQQRKEGK